MTPREISKGRSMNIISKARTGQDEFTKEVLHRTHSSTVLKGISFGICPVVLHLTLIRVLPKGVQVHRYGQTLSQATTSHRTKTICLRVIIHITSKPVALCWNKENICQQLASSKAQKLIPVQCIFTIKI